MARKRCMQVSNEIIVQQYFLLVSGCDCSTAYAIWVYFLARMHW